MVRVNDDYIIEVEPFNFTVKRDLHREKVIVDKVSGEEIRTPSYSLVGFFGDLSQAIWGVIRDMNRQELATGEHDVIEALCIVRRNNQKFMDLLCILVLILIYLRC